MALELNVDEIETDHIVAKVSLIVLVRYALVLLDERNPILFLSIVGKRRYFTFEINHGGEKNK